MPLCFPQQVCDSYPTELYVPRTATAHIIVGSSKFRSRRRFPVLSYYRKDNHVSLKACFCFMLCFSSFIINRPYPGNSAVCVWVWILFKVCGYCCVCGTTWHNTTVLKPLSPVEVDLPCFFDYKGMGKSHNTPNLNHLSERRPLF